ncbi:MAG TPA: cation:proton antiporter, partial [bacterium]|nr:cation:proton antiporter [bacterium]
MEITIDFFHYILLAATVMLLVGVLSSKISNRLGISSILVFIVIGILAGSEGPGGIFFENYQAAQFFGIIALSFIIFDGGLNTQWSEVKPLLLQGFSLATAGVLLTAVITGSFAVLILGFSPEEGFLLGAIISSTDAASVFSILRSRRIKLANQIQNLLELESGSNDPMAVFLTLGCITLM